MRKHRWVIVSVWAVIFLCFSGCAVSAVSGIHEPVDAPMLPSESGEPENTGIPSPTAAPSSTPPPSKAPSPSPSPSPSPVPSPIPTPLPTPAPTEKAQPEFIYPIHSFDDKTRICLTFDDGGDKKSVMRALEVLKQHELKCTFFVVGKYMKAHEDLWKQAAEEGHLICNHTQNHKYLSDLKDEEVKKEILEWESTATEILGQEYVEKMKQEFPYIRLPGGAGHKSKRVLRIVSELGYTPVGWSIETYYAVLRHHNLGKEPLSGIAEEVLAHVTKRAKGGAVILLHFNPYDTARLDEIITGIKAKNMTLHPLPDCLPQD